MTWLNRLMGRAHVHTLSTGKGVVSRRIAVPGEFVSPVLLARGKWVVYNNRVGIVADVNSSGVVELHYTDAAGVTVETRHVPVGEIRLAKCSEIPAPRRPSAEIGRTLGYF